MFNPDIYPNGIKVYLVDRESITGKRQVIQCTVIDNATKVCDNKFYYVLSMPSGQIIVRDSNCVHLSRHGATEYCEIQNESDDCILRGRGFKAIE